MNTPGYFDDRSAEWSGLYQNDPRFRRRFSRITDLLGKVLPPTSGTALDIGCGSGVFSRYLASLGWKVTGVDASPDMIAEARKTSQDVTYEVNTIESLECPDASVDLILSLSMLEYVEDDEAAIARMSRMLKKGGMLVVSVPNRSGWTRRVEKVVYGIRTVTRDRLFGDRGEYLKYQKHQYTPFELDLLMRQHGLRRRQRIFLNAGVDSSGLILRLLERRWWAAMYCAAYEKS